MTCKMCGHHCNYTLLNIFFYFFFIKLKGVGFVLGKLIFIKISNKITLKEIGQAMMIIINLLIAINL